MQSLVQDVAMCDHNLDQPIRIAIIVFAILLGAMMALAARLPRPETGQA